MKKTLWLAGFLILIDYLYAQQQPVSLPWRPKVIAMDSKDNLYIFYEDMLLKIAPDGSSGYVTENIAKDFRGSRSPACNMMVFDSKDNLYMAGQHSGMIWKMDPSGKFSLFAGQGTFRNVRKDGPASEADFANIFRLAIDRSDNVWVMEEGYSDEKIKGQKTYVIRKVTPDGTVSTLKNKEGNPLLIAGYNDMYCSPDGGLIFLRNDCIARLKEDGSMETVVGQCKQKVCPVYKAGDLKTAQIAFPSGIVFDKKGTMYISADIQRILKVENNKLIEVAGVEKIGPPCYNTVSGTYGGYRDGKANKALFNNPGIMVMDSKENIYILEKANGAVRKLTKNGMVSTVARMKFKSN
jgi:hypothetical protein